jgi:hypothetical protein
LAAHRAKFAKALAQAHLHLGGSEAAHSLQVHEARLAQERADDAIAVHAAQNGNVLEPMNQQGLAVAAIRLAGNQDDAGHPLRLQELAGLMERAHGQSQKLLRAPTQDLELKRSFGKSAVVMYQDLMKKTRDFPLQASETIDTLQAASVQRGSQPTHLSAQERSLHEAQKFVLQAPESDAAWRYAERTLAATSVGMYASSGLAELAPEAPALKVEPEVTFEELGVAIDQAEWMKSKGVVHGDIYAVGIDSFTEEYREAIRAYFSRMGEVDPR